MFSKTVSLYTLKLQTVYIVHTVQCMHTVWCMLYILTLYHSTFHTHFLQPRNDTLPALDVLKEYLGLMHEFPDTLDLYKGCLSKVRDCERMREEGRIDVSALTLCMYVHIQVYMGYMYCKYAFEW